MLKKIKRWFKKYKKRALWSRGVGLPAPIPPLWVRCGGIIRVK